MVIEVPDGIHSTELNFKDISIGYCGKVISIFSFILIPLMQLFEKRNLLKNKFLRQWKT